MRQRRASALKQSYLNAKLLKRVEEVYMEGEMESERRNVHSAALKSMLSSAKENGDTHRCSIQPITR